MNTLSQRLKYAKRELTALKTAHPRGLGNLRVYRKSETLVTPGASGIYNATITGTFSSLFSPYPFVQALLGPTPQRVVSLQFNDFEYTNSGMGFKSVLTGWFTAGGVEMTLDLLSLAPVEDLEVVWESN